MEKLTLQLALVIPGVPDERDSCIARLTELLKAKGLESVHVVQQDGRPFLCLHYEPAQFSLQQVSSMAEIAGAGLSEGTRRGRTWSGEPPGRGAPIQRPQPRPWSSCRRRPYPSTSPGHGRQARFRRPRPRESGPRTQTVHHRHWP